MRAVYCLQDLAILDHRVLENTHLDFFKGSSAQFLHSLQMCQPSLLHSFRAFFSNNMMLIDSSRQFSSSLIPTELFSLSLCEISAIPCNVSCSQTRSTMEKSMRDVDPFSSFGKPLSKGGRNRELESVQDSQMERERILSEQRNFYDILEMKGDQAFQGKYAARTRLSEAQPELDRREWKMRNADPALSETGMQLQSKRTELYQANQLTDQTRRERSWVCHELEMRNRAFQENRDRNCHEIEEWQRFCCTEAERARQLRCDELSTQQKRILPQWTGLWLRFRNCQTRWVSSLNDAKEFHDPEHVSSSGFSHVPSQPMSIPSPRGMISRDSCVQPDTRNSLGTSGRAWGEPSSAFYFFFFWNSKNLASSSCKLKPIDTGKIAEKGEGLRKALQS